MLATEQAYQPSIIDSPRVFTIDDIDFDKVAREHPDLDIEYYRAFMEEMLKPEESPWKQKKEAKKAKKKLTSAELHNRKARLNACGKNWTYAVEVNGDKRVYSSLCGTFRLCPNCRLQKFEREIEDRLNRARTYLPIGTNLQFLIIKEEKQEALLKRISRAEGNYLRLPQINNLVLIIHNTDISVKKDEVSADLEEWVYLDEDDSLDRYDHAQIDFNQVLKDIPEGERMSGDLGKKKEEEEEEEEGSSAGGGADEDLTERPIMLWKFQKDDLTERSSNISFDAAVAESQDMIVNDIDSLENALFVRVYLWAKQHDATMFYDYTMVTDKDVEAWNSNPNNVQIVGNDKDKTITYYSDKEAYMKAFFAHAEGDPRVNEAWDYAKSKWESQE